MPPAAGNLQREGITPVEQHAQPLVHRFVERGTPAQPRQASENSSEYHGATYIAPTPPRDEAPTCILAEFADVVTVNPIAFIV